MFTRILVPYDGSKFSKKALQRAIEVAHNLDSEIFLFSVVNVGYISPPGMLHGLTRTKSEKDAIKRWAVTVKKDAETMLQSAVGQCKRKGITARYNVSQGNIPKEILDFAKKKKATIIIIGSQGLHGIGKLKSLGSVSRKVSEHADCPVLIIR